MQQSTANTSTMRVQKRFTKSASSGKYASARPDLVREIMDKGINCLEGKLDLLYSNAEKSINKHSVNADYHISDGLVGVASSKVNAFTSILPASGNTVTVILTNEHSITSFDVDENYLFTQAGTPYFAKEADPTQAQINRDKHLFRAVDVKCMQQFEAMRDDGIIIETSGDSAIVGISTEGLVSMLMNMRKRTEGTVNYRSFTDYYHDWRTIKKTDAAMCMLSHLHHFFHHELTGEMFFEPELVALASQSLCVMAAGAAPALPSLSTIAGGHERTVIHDGDSSWVAHYALAAHASAEPRLLYGDEIVMWGNSPPTLNAIEQLRAFYDVHGMHLIQEHPRVEGASRPHYRILFNNVHSFEINGAQVSMGAFTALTIKRCVRAIGYMWRMHRGVIEPEIVSDTVEFLDLVTSAHPARDLDEEMLFLKSVDLTLLAIANAGGGSGPGYELMKCFAHYKKASRFDIERLSALLPGGVLKRLQLPYALYDHLIVNMIDSLYYDHIRDVTDEQRIVRYDDDGHIRIIVSSVTLCIVNLIYQRDQERMKKLQAYVERCEAAVCATLYGDDVDVIALKDTIDQLRVFAHYWLSPRESAMKELISEFDSRDPLWCQRVDGVLSYAAAAESL